MSAGIRQTPQFERGRWFEREIARQLRQRGYFVVETCNINDGQHDAPMAKGPLHGLIAPDLQVFKSSDPMSWVEASSKRNSTYRYLSSTFEHGIGLTHYRNSLDVGRLSGVPVHLVVGEERSGDILIRNLARLGEPRIYDGPNMPGGEAMAFWPRDRFIPVGALHPGQRRDSAELRPRLHPGSRATGHPAMSSATRVALLVEPEAYGELAESVEGMLRRREHADLQARQPPRRARRAQRPRLRWLRNRHRHLRGSLRRISPPADGRGDGLREIRRPQQAPQARAAARGHRPADPQARARLAVSGGRRHHHLPDPRAGWAAHPSARLRRGHRALPDALCGPAAAAAQAQQG